MISYYAEQFFFGSIQPGQFIEKLEVGLLHEIIDHVKEHLLLVCKVIIKTGLTDIE